MNGSVDEVPRPLVVTPAPSRVPGAWFDEEAVDRVVRFARLCRHTKTARWAGKPFEWDDWQLEHVIRPVFGWKHPDGTRIVRTAWIEVPRKNGKTTLAAVLSLYLLAADREPGADVFAAAAGRDQVDEAFGPASAMVQMSPALSRKLQVFKSSIVNLTTRSSFRAVSSAYRTKHGLNVHGAIIDEVHVHRDRNLIDALETGTGARSQPLIVMITTAGEEGDGTIYAEKHEYCRKVASGVVDDPTFHGVIYAAEPEDDWRDPAVHRKANPGYGRSVSAESLATAAVRAEASPAALQSVLRFNLNIRSRLEARWMPLERWDASAGMVDETALKGRECVGGLDIGRANDIAALCWDFPDGNGGHDVVWRFWIPADSLQALDERTAGNADVWVREGRLRVTDGDVVDYERIEADILADRGTFDVVDLGYNRRGGLQLAQNLAAAGLEMVETTLGITLAPATQELERLVGAKSYRHGGHRVARWMVDNLTVKLDREGNAWPDKGKSRDVVTGPVAAVIALDRVLRHEAAAEEETGVVTYEDRVQIGPRL